jgi:hypothetical protein
MSGSESTGLAEMPVRRSLVRLDLVSPHCWRVTFREARRYGCDGLAEKDLRVCGRLRLESL